MRTLLGLITGFTIGLGFNLLYLDLKTAIAIYMGTSAGAIAMYIVNRNDKKQALTK